MTGGKCELNQLDLAWLASIQRDLIEPAIAEKLNCDVVIKIRDGKVNFAEAVPTDRKRITYAKIRTLDIFCEKT